MTEIYFQRTDLAKYGTWIQKNCLETDALTNKNREYAYQY